MLREKLLQPFRGRQAIKNTEGYARHCLINRADCIRNEVLMSSISSSFLLAPLACCVFFATVSPKLFEVALEEPLKWEPENGCSYQRTITSTAREFRPHCFTDHLEIVATIGTLAVLVPKEKTSA
jgi:hypothetical protein